MSTWAERQRAFGERVGSRSPADLDDVTTVALPSATFPVDGLRKIVGIQHYEERMLFTALTLDRSDRRLVYLTSLPVDEAIVEYYLRFVPDPAGARQRLHLVGLGDAGPEPLTQKLLERPDVVEHVRDLAGDAERAYVLPFNVTVAERRLADQLGLPVFGPDPAVAFLGTKTGSRRVARRAGVAVLPGRDGLQTLDEVAAAIQSLREDRPGVKAVVVKLNEGFSGQGNAIVKLDGPLSSMAQCDTTFCAADEEWSSFEAKIAREGAIVEELLRSQGVTSPSVQVRIAPSGDDEILSTHDQILGGTGNQVYLGCRFPADAAYRLAIQDTARKVAGVLSAEGVMGSFGIDFLVVPEGPEAGIYLSEINLRMGGTTHPFWMARLATRGTYDVGVGELLAGGRPTSYVATDNLKSERLVGMRPSQVIDAVDRAGLGYDPSTRTGATLHLLGAVPGFGKMGVTCIAGTPEDADALYRAVLETVDSLVHD